MNDLLWPNGAPPSNPASAWATDLELTILSRALALDSRHAPRVHDLLVALAPDVPTIHYRQAILADLRASPTLQASLEAQLPALASLGAAGRNTLWSAETPLLEVARRLSELDLYVSTVTALREALSGERLHAEGWLTLRDELDRIASDPLFARLAAELPALKRPLEQLSSVTIGINLDASLRPTGATLVSINDFRFAGQRDLLSRLFGGRAEGSPGLTPLRPANPETQDPFSLQLLRDLERLVGDVAQSLANGVAQFSRISGGTLGSLRDGFAFYLGAARLVERLRAAGLPLATPTLRPAEERHTELEALYDVTLALQLLNQGRKANLVLNDAHLNGQGRVAILTGPNRGGKTTFTRAVGLAHVMAQAGLPVPARRAVVSPVDAIFTEFAAGEPQTVGMGRFDQEAQQLAAIFDRATPHSLILLNEPLSGTNPDEAFHVARGVVVGFQHLGARTILATHLHALAREAPAITAEMPAAPVVSLVASPSQSSEQGDGVQRSFRILPGPPTGESRALEIARQHGLSLEQVTARLRERGLLSEP